MNRDPLSPPQRARKPPSILPSLDASRGSSALHLLRGHGRRLRQDPPLRLRYTSSTAAKKSGWGVRGVASWCGRGRCLVARSPPASPLIHPSRLGSLVTCAYLPHTTLPDVVTSPSSDTLTCEGEGGGVSVCMHDSRLRAHAPPHHSLPPSALTSMTVPLVITPSAVYMAEEGFFFTPRMSRWKVVCGGGLLGGRVGSHCPPPPTTPLWQVRPPHAP